MEKLLETEWSQLEFPTEVRTNLNTSVLAGLTFFSFLFFFHSRSESVRSKNSNKDLWDFMRYKWKYSEHLKFTLRIGSGSDSGEAV